MKQNTSLELTPKNLYRLITGRLTMPGMRLPVTDQQVRGMTLVSFWRRLLQDVLSDETLITLFPDQGKRPRAQSDLMNRTGSNPTPRILRSDAGERFSPEVLLTLVSNCSEILTFWNYDAARFRNALDRFEDRCAAEDPFLNAAMYHHLLLLRSDYTLPFDGVHSPTLFRDSFRLAWNALLALFGPDMNGEELRRLQVDQQAMPASLWKRLCADSDGSRIQRTDQVYGQLTSSPLPREEYIPLTETPEKILRMLREKKKLFLNGIGGSGKTQLAGQAALLARQQSVYETLVMMTVSDSLTVSMAQLFPEKVDSRADDPLEKIWEWLDHPSTLLVADGLDSISDEEHVLKKLQTLSCHVLATGRIASLEGFTTVAVPRLGEEDGVRLLLQTGRGYFTEKDRAGLISLSNRAGGHPLMLHLLAAFCQTCYMTPEDMLDHLSSNGFMGIPLNGDPEQRELLTYLEALFIRVPLREKERKLMRLLAMLPENTWRPSALGSYAMDIDRDALVLAAMMERLSSLGLLQRELTGYCLHPVIAEVFRNPDIQAAEFPLLWSVLRQAYDGNVSPQLQQQYMTVLRMVQTTAEPNRDALWVLDHLCATVMTRPSWQAQPWMLDQYTAWLDKLPHTPADEVDLIASRMLWCTVLPWRDQLDGLAEKLERYSALDLQSASHFILLVNMMEIGGSFIRRDRLQTLLVRLRPQEDRVFQLINYLNFYGGVQRGVLKDPEAALETLTEARKLILAHDYLGTVEDATNDTRMAYTLADLKRYEETLPLMTSVLEILRKRGYTDDSPTMTASRNALSFFRGKCGDRISARDALKAHLDKLKKDSAPVDDNYLSIMCNYSIILRELYQLEEAEQVAREAVKRCRELPVVGPAKLPDALDHLAEILRMQHKPAEALGYYMEADALFRKNYPATNPRARNCRRHMAETMIALGQKEEGNRILNEIAENR